MSFARLGLAGPCRALSALPMIRTRPAVGGMALGRPVLALTETRLQKRGLFLSRIGLALSNLT